MHRKPLPDHVDALPDVASKGRGSVSNQQSSRFDMPDTVRIDDGWDRDPGEDDGPPLKTVLGVDSTRRIITRNTSPDVRFDRSINPYKGCEHGCIYCFARPTHAYLGLSPGLDFETKIFRKPNAPELLRSELSAKGYSPATIQLGINTDAYQPTERSERLTRRILEVLAEFSHPVAILTRSALIQRDIDILAPMAEKNLVKTGVSVTTLDRELARIMEPRAATPGKRIETIRALAAAKIPVTIMSAPIIPGLTCHELESILKAGAEAGAKRAGMTLIRLPYEIKTLFEEWLRNHKPDRADRVLNLIRQCRDGKLNQSEFGTRMVGTGKYAELMQQRFLLAKQRYGLDRSSRELETGLFRKTTQMSLF